MSKASTKKYKRTKKNDLEQFPRDNLGSYDFNLSSFKDISDQMLQKKRKQKKNVKSEEAKQEETIKLEDSQGETENQSRIMQPRFQVGDQLLMAVCEVRKDYFIANFIRNKKVIVHRNYSGEETLPFTQIFKIGDFVPGVLVSNEEHRKTGKDNKLVASIDPKVVNAGLKPSSLTVGMDVWGRLVSHDQYVFPDLSLEVDEDDFEEVDEKEVNIHFEDKGTKRKAGEFAFFRVTAVKQGEDSIDITFKLSNDVSPIRECKKEDIKPGFMFKAALARTLENGAEVSFIAGGATIFADHLRKGNTMLCRVVYVSKDGKISFSSKENIRKLRTNAIMDKITLIGKVFSAVRLEEKLFGNSFSCSIGNRKAFIHSTYVRDESVGQTLPECLAKEYNFFDDRVGLTTNTKIISWNTIKVGHKGTGKIKLVQKDYILVEINDHLVGKCPSPLIEGNRIRHFKAGKQIDFVVFGVDFDTRNILLTTKKEYLQCSNFKLSPQECKEGDEFITVYKGKNIYQHSGNVQGLMAPRENPEPAVGSVRLVAVSMKTERGLVFSKPGEAGAWLDLHRMCRERSKNNGEINVLPGESGEMAVVETDTACITVEFKGETGIIPRELASDFSQGTEIKSGDRLNAVVLLAEAGIFAATSKHSVVETNNSGVITRIISQNRLELLTRDGVSKVFRHSEAALMKLGQSVSFSSNGEKVNLLYFKGAEERIVAEADLLAESFLILQSKLRKEGGPEINDIIKGTADKQIDFGFFITFKERPDFVGFLNNNYSGDIKLKDIADFQVIDIDYENNILYLNTEIVSTTGESLNLKEEHQFVIELLHDNYASLALESNRTVKAVLPINAFNKKLEQSEQLKDFQVGSKLNSKVRIFNNRYVAVIPSEIVNSYLSESNFTVKIGSTVSATVNSVKSAYTYVKISKNVFGRVSTKFFNQVKEGEKMNLKIVNVNSKGKRSVCECIDPSVDLSPFESEDSRVALVTSVYPTSKYPLNVYFAGSFHNIHFSQIPLGVENKFEDIYVGQTIECLLQNGKPTLRQSQVKEGFLCNARVVKKIEGRGLALSLGEEELPGFVDLTHISDDLFAFPTEAVPEKSIVPCRVLSYNKKLNKHFVSLRNSLLEDEAYTVSQEGSAYNFGNVFSEFEAKADLRLKIDRFNTDALSPNSVVIGYVTSSSEKGVFIKLGSNLAVRANTRELVDENVLKPFLLFKPGQLVIGRIINIKKDGKINVSLRESVVKHNIGLSLKKLEKSAFYYTFINSQTDDHYIATILGSTFTGKLKKSNLTIEKPELPLKSIQVLCITGIDKTVNPVKISFSAQNCAVTDNVIVNSEIYLKEEQNAIFAQLFASVQNIVTSFEQEEHKEEIADIQTENKEFDLFLEEEPEEEGEEEEEEEEFGEPMEDIHVSNEDKQAFFEEEEEEDEEQISNAKLAKEMKLREIEDEEEEKEPETMEDFEKAILGNPDESIYWIKYASLVMDKIGVEKAREVFNRALKNIQVNARKERLKVWIAKINLENAYGDDESLKMVITEAINANDKLGVVKHLVELFRDTEKAHLAYDVIVRLRKTYFEDTSLWKIYLEFIFENRNFEDPREGLKKAMQSLGKMASKCLEVRVFFANLLYKHGFVEEGQNDYENILQENPKKLDIWLSYAAKEIKVERDADTVRRLFHKALRQGWNAKQLQTLLKYFLNFEKKFGTEETQQAAIQLAQDVSQGKEV